MTNEAKWNSTNELVQRNSGGIHKRLVNDKDQMLVAFRGDPHGTEMHWLTALQDYAPCAATGCVH